ncbi:MAG: c-type cytochrome [Chlorobi bacterium]|nr:c-type cytochrome [Chlorobiota bacterium]
MNEKLVEDTKMTDQPNFFRCKSCHGWDLKGRTGVLIDKASSETYPEVADVNLVEEVRVNDGIREIFDAIKHTDGRDPSSGTYTATMPNFSTILTDADIWDLVKFIKETAHQTDDFYTLTTTGTYPNGTKSFSDIGKDGDAAAGLATYNAKCVSCHGADGSKINVYCKGIWLGNMFRDDPHEIQHKAIWGMPLDREHIAGGCTDAGAMSPTGITDDDVRNLMVMGQDTVAFPDYHE